MKNPQLVGSKMPPEELIFVAPNFAKYTKAGGVEDGGFMMCFLVGGIGYSNSRKREGIMTVSRSRIKHNQLN